MIPRDDKNYIDYKILHAFLSEFQSTAVNSQINSVSIKASHSLRSRIIAAKCQAQHFHFSQTVANQQRRSSRGYTQ